MELLKSLLKELFGKAQCGGQTFSVIIHMRSEELCSGINKISTAGGSSTEIKFNPPLPLEHALLYARQYNNEGSFTHGNDK